MCSADLDNSILTATVAIVVLIIALVDTIEITSSAVATKPVASTYFRPCLASCKSFRQTAYFVLESSCSIEMREGCRIMQIEVLFRPGGGARSMGFRVALYTHLTV